MVRLLLKRYADAETSYGRVLKLVQRLEGIEDQAKTNAEASVYHNLGLVAGSSVSGLRPSSTTSRRWKSRSNTRIATHRLRPSSIWVGVAEEQRQWSQAREYCLTALPVYFEFQDNHNLSIVVRSLARLWKVSDDDTIPDAVTEILGGKREEAEEMLRKLAPGESAESED